MKSGSNQHYDIKQQGNRRRNDSGRQNQVRSQIRSLASKVVSEACRRALKLVIRIAFAFTILVRCCRHLSLHYSCLRRPVLTTKLGERFLKRQLVGALAIHRDRQCVRSEIKPQNFSKNFHATDGAVIARPCI